MKDDPLNVEARRAEGEDEDSPISVVAERSGARAVMLEIEETKFRIL